MMKVLNEIDFARHKLCYILYGFSVQWMQTKSTCPLCPVCKAKLEKSKVIPVYGRGMQDQKDPRQESVQEERLPPRPRGHRTGKC